MNKKKTTQWLLSFVLLLTATLFTACSNSDSNSAIDEENQPAGPQGSLVSFGITTNKYSEVSRAAQENEGRVVSSSTENLGNGLEALVEVVETPTKTANTRAVGQAPAGDYTILAYQGTELKQKWEINYKSDGTYTMKDGSNPEKYLAPGSYQFYAFNDKISFDNGKIVTKMGSNETEAYYEKQDVTIANVLKSKVTFTLKPTLSQVYFKVKAFSNAAFNGPMTGKFSYAANTIPESLTLDPATGATTTTKNTTAGNIAVGSFTANQSNATESSFIVTTAPRYFVPGTDITKLLFTFNTSAEGTTGKIYDKEVSGKQLRITEAIAGNLEAGKSYTVSVTVYYKADYLFTDGTVGTLLANKNKTPIALVVNKDKRMAIALKNVGDKQWTTVGRRQNSRITYSYNQAGLTNAKNNCNGYDETWQASFTMNPSNVAKATSSNFPAFQAVAQYKNPVNGNNWYMPGVGDWDLALQYFGVANSTNGYSMGNPASHSWGGSLGYQLAEILFYQVNGDAFDTWYWTANAWAPGNSTAISITLNKDNIHFGGATKTDPAKSRPFIKY
ncbi:fimbrillin family protein [Prevotella pallens]|uniref:fimbrillin family protein n=1 Tax=Prevotella pallens TaxID=60133 RepID=UPI0023F16B70|nr:fimbrillin family protein [Prevotella pallens]